MASDFLAGPKNSTLSPVPFHIAGRELFLRLLDSEWPELKQTLFQAVWASYRQILIPVDVGSVDELPEWPRIRPLLRPGWGFHSVAGLGTFTYPLAMTSWKMLRAAESDHQLAELARGIREWAGQSGRGVVDDWMLQAALDCLGSCPPTLEAPTVSAKWELNLLRRVPRFSPNLTKPHWYPDPFNGAGGYYGTWPEFERRMKNEFNRELSKYRKQVVASHDVLKTNMQNYARWTIARLSGETWKAIVARYSLDRYSEGETQVKKRVREFAAEIDLTLGEIVGTMGQNPPKNSHKRP